MFKFIVSVAMVLSAWTAQANVSASEVLFSMQAPHIASEVQAQALNWKVGDTNNYKIDMGFIKGTMKMSVKSIAADGIWLEQLADLGFAGKQTIETLIDPNTGEIKKMLVNGKEQEAPKSNVEIIELKEDRITVPAGTFDCIHARIKDLDQNQEINQWVNPQQIPISGMLKSVAPSQFGQVTITLTSFKKN